MKYKLLTDETKVHNGVTLYRIQSLKDFSDVTSGDKGGWIEKESNLSHEGNAWIYDNAKVSGDAEVYESAQIRGNAEVNGDSKIYEYAKVGGHAKIPGKVEVFGDTIFEGFTEVL